MGGISKDIEAGLGRSHPELEADQETIAVLIRSTAKRYQGNDLALLRILRNLEALHREIREGLFQESLPDNRQALHALLKDMESEGGWPYIKRMRLQEFLNHLLEQACVEQVDGLEPESGGMTEPSDAAESVECKERSEK